MYMCGMDNGRQAIFACTGNKRTLAALCVDRSCQMIGGVPYCV